MICDDCLFQLGIDEYEYHRPSMNRRFRCTVCDEVVPTRRESNFESRLILAITKKEDLILKYLPITFITFRNACKHFYEKKCYYLLSKNNHRERKKKFYPEICDKDNCPIIFQRR